ncbi:MAG: aminotransferase class I/II-fold pyridoxal phosphate-dependent enzyme [Cloacibacillus evryensis]
MAQRAFIRYLTSKTPGGCTSPLERRKEILAIAAKYDVPIFEDDPYHYLSYDEEAPATYLGLAGDDRRVLHSNSFSKLVAPGMRCGWLVVPDAIIPHLNAFRISAGLTRPAILQLGLFNYLNNANFGERVGFLRDTYRVRRDGMVKAIEKHLKPLGIKTNYPKGGFFLWGEARGVDDMTAFARFAVERRRSASSRERLLHDRRSEKRTRRLPHLLREGRPRNGGRGDQTARRGFQGVQIIIIVIDIS